MQWYLFAFNDICFTISKQRITNSYIWIWIPILWSIDCAAVKHIAGIWAPRPLAALSWPLVPPHRTHTRMHTVSPYHLPFLISSLSQHRLREYAHFYRISPGQSTEYIFAVTELKNIRDAHFIRGVAQKTDGQRQYTCRRRFRWFLHITKVA